MSNGVDRVTKLILSTFVFALLCGAYYIQSPPPVLAVDQTNSRTETLILSYSAFGPQAMAFETIGYEWYQRNRVGNCDPNAPQDYVRVVIYRYISLQEAKRRYPVVMEKQDYRYLSYEDALAYLDEQEKVVSEIEEMSDSDLIRQFKETRESILTALGR